MSEWLRMSGIGQILHWDSVYKLAGKIISALQTQKNCEKEMNLQELTKWKLAYIFI